MKTKTEKNCSCIEQMDELLKKESLSLELVFSISGKVWPGIFATNEDVRKKGGRKIRKIMVPTYCPWCGKKYEN